MFARGSAPGATAGAGRPSIWLTMGLSTLSASALAPVSGLEPRGAHQTVLARGWLDTAQAAGVHWSADPKLEHSFSDVTSIVMWCVALAIAYNRIYDHQGIFQEKSFQTDGGNFQKTTGTLRLRSLQILSRVGREQRQRGSSFKLPDGSQDAMSRRKADVVRAA